MRGIIVELATEFTQYLERFGICQNSELRGKLMPDRVDLMSDFMLDESAIPLQLLKSMSTRIAKKHD